MKKKIIALMLAVTMLVGAGSSVSAAGKPEEVNYKK